MGLCEPVGDDLLVMTKMELNWTYNWTYNCSQLHAMGPPDENNLVSCFRSILNPLRSKLTSFLCIELALVKHF